MITLAKGKLIHWRERSNTKCMTSSPGMPSAQAGTTSNEDDLAVGLTFSPNMGLIGKDLLANKPGGLVLSILLFIFGIYVPSLP